MVVLAILESDEILETFDAGLKLPSFGWVEGLLLQLHQCCGGHHLVQLSLTQLLELLILQDP